MGWVVHYSEIGIKGDNRVLFERQLVRNIRQALGEPRLPVGREFGRLRVEVPALPEAEVAERLGRLPGIANYARATPVPLELEALRASAVQAARAGHASCFRIQTRRSSKRFPMTSVELNRELGRAVVESTGLAVDLGAPDLTIHVEITDRDALVYVRRFAGIGGLPVGISGKVVALLSGGIDSPVAAFRLMRRGASVVLVHFHNYGRDQSRVRDKLLDLARALTRHQLETLLYLVPFEELQEALIAAVPPGARMVAYRRMMLKLAASVAEHEGAKAFVTGDSLGQVASQTLDNLQAIYAASPLPVLTPLIGEDKDAIVAVARRIGTFDISVRPYEDCCSFLVARHPDTRVRLAPLEARESRIPLDELGGRALAAAERHELHYP